MFSKKLKKHIHNFDVVWHKGGVEHLVQQLHCKTCDKHFIGYGGYLGNPNFIHEMKHQLSASLLESPEVIEKVGQLGGKK